MNSTDLPHSAAPSLQQRAYNIRRHALIMGQVQGQGYIGQALGAADLLAVSYFHALRYRADEPDWEPRDRFYLSIGHYAIALYAALLEAGILPLDERETYGADDSRLPMSGMAPNTLITRVSSAPVFSSATRVLSKSALAGLLAIFSTSASFCLMPSSIAGA